MKTEELLEKYFEGQTTCEEERHLRRLFASDQVPDHLKIYRPLFACIDREAEVFKPVETTEENVSHTAGNRRKKYTRPRLYYLSAGIAAIALLCIGIAGLLLHTSAKQSNHVIIDGRYYDDPQLVQAKALEALENVSFTEEELKENILSNLLP